MANKKFVVEPTIVDELGKSLYSEDNAIIVELIANSYDADASNVTINYNSEEKYIEVIDDGHGMSESKIDESFLKVGVKSKDNIPTEKYNRIPLGRKGIGKLSFFALGKKIDIETSDGDHISKFSLNYEELMKKNNDISFENTKALNSDTYTKIKIHDFNHEVFKKKFLDSMVKGISMVFNELIESDDFNVNVNFKNFQYTEKQTLDGNYKIKRELPKFGQTLVFMSLSEEYDELISKVKEESNEHLQKMLEASSLKGEEISQFWPSTKTWEYINKSAPFTKDGVIDNNKGIKFNLKGFIASNITFKAIGNDEKEKDALSNDELKIGEDKTLIIQESNRRISLSANGRSGDLNIKGKVNLADKFYTKYLFGNLSMAELDNNELGEIALPNREGYRRNNDRWRYVSVITKILGDYAMNFANALTGKRKKKAEETYSHDVEGIREKFKVEFSTASDDENKSKIFEKMISEISAKKENKSLSTHSGFILLSYRNISENGKKFSECVATIFKKLKDSGKLSNVRVLYTNETAKFGFGKSDDSMLYHEIKSGISDKNEPSWNDPYSYYKYHTFAFIDKEYVDNWQTDIEYGMSFVNSELSGHGIPIDITTFDCTEDESERNTVCGENTPLHQDSFYKFSKEIVIKKMKYVFEKFYIKDVTDDELNEIVNESFETYKLD